MTRLGQWGGELGHEHAEGLTLTNTTLTFDTGTVRTGTRSFKFDTSTTDFLSYTLVSPATGRTYYGCMHFLIPAATGLPGTSANIMALIAAFGINVRLTTAGKLQLLNSATQVGSDSAATITTDVWYRVELVVNINAAAGNDDTMELYLDGVQVAASTTVNNGTTAPTVFRFGWVSDPGTSEVIFVDDVALNDSQGSVNNGLVGDQKIYALFPTSDSALGNWTDGAGGTTNIFGSVDNVPPIGVSTATSGATNQVENPANVSIDRYEATMTTYTTAGIGASDTITAIQPVVEVGSSSTTGTDTINSEVLSNPVIAAGVATSCDIVAGTYPASWIVSTKAIVENPTVTLGTAPVMRIQKNIATTRINSCCMMAMVVSVSPGAAATPNLTYKPLRSMTRLRR